MVENNSSLCSLQEMKDERNKIESWETFGEDFKKEIEYLSL